MDPEKVFKTTALIICTHTWCRINSFIKTENIRSFKQHSADFFIHPHIFIALMSIKQAYDSLRITILSLHLSLLMPAFKLGACRWWLLIIISTLATASSLSQYGTVVWQTLHQHTEQGTDPNTKSFQLKWMSGAKANRETGCVQCPMEHVRKQAMNLITVPGTDYLSLALSTCIP